jgi:hypothetical protein
MTASTANEGREGNLDCNQLLMRLVLREPGSPAWLEDEGHLARSILGAFPEADEILGELMFGWRNGQCVAISRAYIEKSRAWSAKKESLRLRSLEAAPEATSHRPPEPDPDEPEGDPSAPEVSVPHPDELGAELDALQRTLAADQQALFEAWRKGAAIYGWQTTFAAERGWSDAKVSKTKAKVRILVASWCGVQDPEALLKFLAERQALPEPKEKDHPPAAIHPREWLLEYLARPEHAARWRDYLEVHRDGKPTKEIVSRYPDDPARLQLLHEKYKDVRTQLSRDNRVRAFLATLRTDKVSLVKAVEETLPKGLPQDWLSQVKDLAREDVSANQVAGKLGLTAEQFPTHLQEFYHSCRLQHLAREGVPEEQLPGLLGLTPQQLQDLLKRLQALCRARRVRQRSRAEHPTAPNDPTGR